MIMADKIIALRKKNGWSQEELADRVGVSRQSVSKWEGAQSVPDLSKVLQLAELFGVSTDSLLKDEIEDAEYLGEARDDTPPNVRRVSMEEANAFLAAKAETAPKIVLATLLCVLSPICLIVLGAAADSGALGISEDLAGLLGLIALFVFVAPAVALYIGCGMKTSRFEYLEKEAIETEYGVSGMVRERQRRYRDTYARFNILGACACILSVIPLFATAALTENALTVALGLAATMTLAGAGAGLFIAAGIPWTSMEKLLQEGDYTPDTKRQSAWRGAVATAYWLLVTAAYLGYSLSTDDWQKSWVVWPVAGVLFAAIMIVCGAVRKRS